VGIRVGDLRFPDTLPEKLTKLVEYYQRSFPLEVNLNHEIEAYKAFAHKLQVRRCVCVCAVDLEWS
jgi:hypothetical protein